MAGLLGSRDKDKPRAMKKAKMVAIVVDVRCHGHLYEEHGDKLYMENRAKMYKLDDILVPDSGSSEEGPDSLDDSVDNDDCLRSS